MENEGKIRVERINDVNFGFWKMQIEDYLYQKDLILPLGEKTHKSKDMSNGERESLDRKSLGEIPLSLVSTVAFNVSKEKTTKDLMAALSKMYEKPSVSLDEDVVQPKDG